MHRYVSSTRRQLLVLMAACSLFAAGCGGDKEELPQASIQSDSVAGSATQSVRGKIDNEPVTLTANGQEFQSPARSQDEFFQEVVIKTSVGSIRIRLNAEKAPRTVDNFLYNYVDNGFYDQTVFHYVDQGYMIAGGGYDSDLREKKARTPIPCEANNGLKNNRGTVAMARHPDFANSATSQFFINLVDNPSLDYRPTEDNTVNGYCVFGEVIGGMDVVDKIAAVNVHDRGDFVNTPVQPVIIESIIRVK